ncbi:MAG: 7-cyano-7-deazaguanine synthase QueC [Gammaproteobacteria bacterium RIFCSPHIGHO2_12_FULL_41_20]|nr:MAG: 7-cyano-7-deazaguanine synthase QueC [Gammaproteobacteria bacterium RIFCSPHIGHO2_12_FULL_41_20]
MQKKAIVLFSGGLDSTTCLALAKSQGFICYALSIEYGQKNRIEINNAKRVAQVLQVAEHKILSLPLAELGGSACTDPMLAVPDYIQSNAIPITYIPARNTIFLSLALAWAEVVEVADIFFGANHEDYAGYPDCRPAYFNAFTAMANLATKMGVEGQAFTIHTPWLWLSKADIIKEGLRLGVDYSATISCYRPNKQGYSCGTCLSCALRKKGFAEAGIPDPTIYSSL